MGAAFDGYDIGELRLDGKALTQDFDASVVSVSFERSMEEASTLTLVVHDPEHRLLESGVLGTAADLAVSSHLFRLRGVSKQGDAFTLVAEDRDVARLRMARGVRKASRNKVTRAEFAKSLVDATGGIRFWCPDLHRKQPFTRADPDQPAKGTKARAQATSRDKGLSPGVSLTVKGAKATSAQKRNMQTVLTVADKLNAGPKATLALVEACIVEPAGYKGSGPFDNPAGGDSSSVGILQLLDSHLGGSTSTNGGRRDVALVARLFLTKGFWGKGGAIALAKANPGWNAGQVAQAVQGSGHPGRYHTVRDDAARIIEAFGADSAAAGEPDVAPATYNKRYEFTRGTPDDPDENTWDCLKRLAEEVRRRRFLIDGELIFAFDRDLIRQKPRMTISEASAGVDWIDYEWETGRKVEACTVTCRADAWRARPGDVVILEDCGKDVGDGRWLVSRISGGLFDLSRSIELTRATQPKGEPRSEVVERGGGSSVAGGSSSSRSGGSGGVAPPLQKILSSSNGYSSGHDGIDLICAPNAPIFAICDARVIEVRSGGWWGKNPTGDVSKGDGIIQLECLVDVGPFRKGMHIGYGHAEKARVRAGATVKAGQQIGRAGFANAWHIHLMVNSGATNRGIGDRDPRPFVDYAVKHG